MRFVRLSASDMAEARYAAQSMDPVSRNSIGRYTEAQLNVMADGFVRGASPALKFQPCFRGIEVGFALSIVGLPVAMGLMAFAELQYRYKREFYKLFYTEIQRQIHLMQIVEGQPDHETINAMRALRANVVDADGNPVIEEGNEDQFWDLMYSDVQRPASQPSVNHVFRAPTPFERMEGDGSSTNSDAVDARITPVDEARIGDAVVEGFAQTIRMRPMHTRHYPEESLTVGADLPPSYEEVQADLPPSYDDYLRQQEAESIV